MPQLLYSPTKKKDPTTHWIRGWMCPRASRESSGDEKISYSCHKSNPGYELYIAVTIMTVFLCTTAVLYHHHDLITLHSFFVLKNHYLSQTVSGIRLCQGKEFHPIPYGQGVCPRNLCAIWHVCNSTAFCPTFKMFLVKPVLCRYFRKFWWSLLLLGCLRVHWHVKLPDIFDFQGQFSIFHNFLCLSSGKAMGQGNCYIYY